MNREKKPNFISKCRADVIVIASVLLIALAILLFTNLTKKEGAYAEITVNGNIAGRYSLTQNGTFALNNGTNILTIENGRAYVSDSNCPDHICENTGKIMHVGETIICLPNRLTVTIVGHADTSVDFVS